MPRIYPVILSGGSGTRLWPLSRSLFPKQLLPLTGSQTMLQETARRVADNNKFAPSVVVCSDQHRFVVAEQLRSINISTKAIVLEPIPRNTAAAVMIAAKLVAEDDPEACLLVLPSDHVIADIDRFHKAIEQALSAAAAGWMVSFGMTPTRAETGYGYIHQGKEISEAPGVFTVNKFIEKPNAEQAASLLAKGGYLWNGGMYLFKSQRVLAEIEKYLPEVSAAAQKAVAKATHDLDFLRLDQDALMESPAISIDYGVMEKTARAAVIPAEIGWSDVGSWASLAETLKPDETGNITSGDVLLEETKRSYVRSEGPLVCTLGIDNIIVVATEDAVLVAQKDQAQKVGNLVQKLRALGRPESDSNPTVYRPWGSYKTVRSGDRFQVKYITVRPHAKLSLQYHHHRAEHWVVVRGTARVTRGSEECTLNENESTYIPPGTPHRLENPGRILLELIEVQSGSYLGEDDIVRLEDAYGRTTKLAQQ